MLAPLQQMVTKHSSTTNKHQLHLMLHEVKPADRLMGWFDLILFQIFPALGARDRHDEVPFCNIQASATCPGLTFLAVAISKTTFAAFTLASKIPFRILFRALDLAGQKAPAKGRKGHEADAQSHECCPPIKF